MTSLPSLPKSYSGNSSTILLETVLQLLGEQLGKLSHSDFFATELGEYVSQLCKCVSSLQNKIAEPDPNVALITEVVESIWRATQFLTGTTSNRVPYEVTYLLRQVLLDWGLGDSIVTTSVNQSPDFYCERAGTAPDALLSELPGLALSGHLVQMGVPEIFQHMPLLCSPLYHEVGHYIEEHDRLITTLSIAHEKELLQAMPDLKEFGGSPNINVATAWATEHFCDLVAACYVGECVSDYIIQWDHEQVPQPTHPSASSRAVVTRDFLEGRSNPVVDLLKQGVAEAGLNIQLQKQFLLPTVDDCFADVRPATVQSIQHLHGLLPAADAFLKRLLTSPSDFKGSHIARVPRWQQPHVINDLIEKSIRSFMIEKAWNESLDTKATA
jgi:hypothetical protein